MKVGFIKVCIYVYFVFINLKGFFMFFGDFNRSIEWEREGERGGGMREWGGK